MENRFKMGISRVFRGSFGSCRTRNLSDVMEKAVFIPQNQNNLDFQITEPLSSSPPKTRPFRSICRPKCPDSSTESATIISRQKVSARNPSPFVSAAAANGHTCPPASPISPLHKDSLFKEAQKCSIPEKNKKEKKKKHKNTHLKSNCRRETTSLFSSTSQEDSQYHGGSYWFSSDEDGENERERGEEDETDTLFSSRSLTSDSSGSRRRRLSSRKKHSGGGTHRRNKAAAYKGASYSHEQMGVLSLDGRVKGSFALVKSSSDPYNDFRTSMVEMIVEKRIFAAKDLEQLLQCFLSLNSYHLHGIIVEVFAEILETLFSG